MTSIELTDTELETSVDLGRSATTSPLDITDEALMEMIQQKDEEAIAILFDRYASVLKALVMRVLHNDAESDDMVQEIFVELWNRAGNYDRSKGKPLGWIVTLARRRAIDRLRSREAYCRMEDRLLTATKHEPRESHSHVEEDAVHSEMREHIARVMASLPPAQQDVIELTYFRGMSQREIAAHTGIPLGTIKTRIELAMAKLSEALRGMEDLL